MIMIAPCRLILILPGQIKKLEIEVKEQSKKVSVKEEAEAEVPIINPGFGNKLLLTQGG